MRRGVDANNAQSGVSFMPAVECDGVPFDLHRPPLFGNVGGVDQTEPLLAIGRLHLILESHHIVLHVLVRHAHVVVGDLVADRGQREWPTGPSVRRVRWRSPPQGWLRLSRSPSQWSTGGRLRPRGRSAQSGFRLDIGEDAYSGLRQGPLHAQYHLLRPSWGRIDAREQK
jgi:hypothetical protein